MPVVFIEVGVELYSLVSPGLYGAFESVLNKGLLSPELSPLLLGEPVAFAGHDQLCIPMGGKVPVF